MASAKSGDKIVVRKPNIQEGRFLIQGTSALLVHRFGEKAKGNIDHTEERNTTESKTKDPVDPERDFQEARYVLEDGRDGVPASAFKAAIKRAAKPVENVAMTDITEMVFVLADGRTACGIPCVAIDGVPQMRTDIVRVGSGSRRAPMLRYRPEFVEWSAVLRVQYDADRISASSLANLIMRAGACVGVGDWRVEKNGEFGRFEICGGAA